MPLVKVAEVQGLYGPFTLSERVVQKVWLQQDFATKGLKTASGKQLKIKHPGRWNFQEGPDFKEARIVLDGTEIIGDVEIHLNLMDWNHHQHGSDTNYDRVVLHVVLYLESINQVAQVQTTRGKVPEMLHLMPLMSQDLESYAMDEALLKLERHNELQWVMQFLEFPIGKRLEILQQQAYKRWQQKLKYAKQRLETEGWEAACHSYALEVLGYKRNRTPMLRLAQKYPLKQMQGMLHKHETQNAPSLTAEQLFCEEAPSWKLNGLRPANHPRKRLEQYLTIVQNQPEWPTLLMNSIKQFPASASASESSTSKFRKQFQLLELKKIISESVFGSHVSDGRLNTIIVDAILPLATAAELIDGSTYWQHWFAGDSPDAIKHFLKNIEAHTRKNPLSNGLIQGALGLFLDTNIQDTYAKSLTRIHS